jgi:hypothetical protein
VLGYEYDYKQGREASTSYNYNGTNNVSGRNLGPASQQLRETVHVVKVDLDYDYKGLTLEDQFRGEFYHLSTTSTNEAQNAVGEKLGGSTSYFQGANTFRVENKFSDWFYASAGYLYSKLDADSAFQLDYPVLLETVTLPEISLERESNIGNVNARLGPFGGLTLTAGILADYTSQSGLGSGRQDQVMLMPLTNVFVPFSVNSDYNEADVEETAALRFSKVPFTTVFAEGKLEQDDIGQSDQFASKEDILSKAVFSQHTIFDGRLTDARLGFDSSPWRFISFNGEYHYSDDLSTYDSRKLIQPVATAYPTFITRRDLRTDEVEGRMVLHPSSFFKTTLSYQYQDSDYELSTKRFLIPPNILISPGGGLTAGREREDIFSLSATLTPMSRLFLDASLSYEYSTIATILDGPAVAPYRGNVYTILADGTYVVSKTTDLFLAYYFSNGDYSQNNFAGGLPLGIDYQRHSAQIGLSRQFGKNVSAKIQYRFDYYNEPSSGGVNNYIAHSVFGTLSFQFK